MCFFVQRILQRALRLMLIALQAFYHRFEELCFLVAR